MKGLSAQEQVQRIEAARRRGEERLQLALDAAKMGTWDFEPATGALQLDGGSRALFGFGPGDDISYEAWLSRVHPEDRSRVDAQVHAALDPRSGGHYDVEYRIRVDGQRERWIHSTGRVHFEGDRATRFVGTQRDISETKALEHAVLLRETELRAAIEALPVMIWIARPDGQLEYLNPRLTQYLGQRASAFLASDWSQVIHPDDLEKFEAIWARAIARGEPFQVERRLKRSDGAYHWFLTRAVPLREDGKVHRWLGTSTDVDDLKRAEAELRKRSEFEQQLIGIVSHDLRNPLSAILVSAQLLERGHGVPPDRQQKTIQRIRTAAERAVRLTRDLLDFTRARVGGGVPVEPGVADFHVVVRRALDEVRSAHPDRTIHHEASGMGEGVLDEDRLAQVVTNLVNNAIAYSPESSPIRVETSGDDQHLVLSVHNEGEPIPPELMPHLFEPLRRGTADGAPGSIGLGLFIVEQIVKAHRGTVTVSSEAGRGTTFTVRLPRTCC